MDGLVYLLRGHQTDFSRNWQPQDDGLFDALHNAVINAMGGVRIQHWELEVAHVGSFVGEFFCRQGQLEGLFSASHPKFFGCTPLSMRLHAHLEASPY